jgi:hypothetical protein
MEFDEILQDRLKQAEMAEREVVRLSTLASQAPELRVRAAKAQKTDQRRRSREETVARARTSAVAAAEKQTKIPELLGTAARAVVELYAALKDVDAQRRHSAEALAIADRIDYDAELEDIEDQEQSMGRDPRGLAYALAARHGDVKVKQMLEELDPGFNLLRGCNVDDPLYRDVANFVVRHAVPKTSQPTGNISESEFVAKANSAPAPERNGVAAN